MSRGKHRKWHLRDPKFQNVMGGMPPDSPRGERLQNRRLRPCYRIEGKLIGLYCSLHGAAKFVEKDGRTVLYLDGTQGTYAETPDIKFQQTDLTIAVWIKLVSPLSSRQGIYADWSSPYQFLFGIDTNGRLCFKARRDVQMNSVVIKVCTDSR